MDTCLFFTLSENDAPLRILLKEDNETFSVVFSTIRFQRYILGKQAMIYNDH